MNVIYRGPAFGASALAQMLEEEGVTVRYTAPSEQRSAREIAETVVISLACSGAYDAIRAGVARFRGSRLGGASSVEVPETPDDKADS